MRKHLKRTKERKKRRNERKESENVEAKKDRNIERKDNNTINLVQLNGISNYLGYSAPKNSNIVWFGFMLY